MLLSLLVVSVLVVVGQLVLNGSEPMLDQQPDAAAKREYAQSVLAEEEIAPAEPAFSESMAVDHREDGTIEPAVTKEAVKSISLSAPVKNDVEAKSESIAVKDIRVDPDYGFYDSLRKDSWPVPISKGVYVDGELADRERPVYKLQAASFRNKTDAYRLMKNLRQQKLKAVVVPSVSTNGQYWYQVSIGPFVSTTKLNKAQDILVSMNMMPLKKRVN